MGIVVHVVVAPGVIGAHVVVTPGVIGVHIQAILNTAFVASAGGNVITRSCPDLLIFTPKFSTATEAFPLVEL